MASPCSDGIEADRQPSLVESWSENHSAGCATIRAAGFGAPIRNRRSDNDSAPPSTITTAPSQINSTSGL
jgi:hypothetical protein